MRPSLLLLACCAGCAAQQPLPPAPEAPALNVGVDMHIHLTMSQAAKPVFRGEPGRGPFARDPNQVLVNQVDAPTLERAGVRLLLASVWPPLPIRPGLTARDQALHQLEAFEAFSQRSPEFVRAGDAQAARDALARGSIACLLQVEGGEGITRADDVDLYFALGARVIVVEHILGNDLGGEAAGQLGGVFGGGEHLHNPQGLTPLGREAVQRMMELGIVVDLAHASDRTSEDILDLAEARGVPVIYSHTGARAFKDAERNLSDAIAQRIVKGGGVIGITLLRRFLTGAPDGEKWTGYQADTCDDVVSTWRHFAQLVGPENLTLGSDFNGFVNRALPSPGCPQGIRHTGDLPHLFAQLQAHGVPRPALDGMAERLLKVVEAVEKKADPQARAQASRRKVEISRPFDVAL